MQAHVTQLASYPIKGLSAVSHDSVSLTEGGGFPQDRMFGFAKSSSGFDPDNPEPLPKDCFLVLMQFEQLAGLQTQFDPESWVYTVRDGENTQRFHMKDAGDRQKACDMLTDYLSLRDDQRPSFQHAAPHRFTDVSVVSERMMHAVSLINVDSVAAFSDVTGHTISPARFRGNILVEGWPAFSELDLVGRALRIGEVTFEIVKRTQRCAATEVDPVTAERDLHVPYLLRKLYGHMDMGIYMETKSPGTIRTGDPLTLL